MKRLKLFIPLVIVLAMVFGAGIISAYADDSLSDRVRVELDQTSISYADMDRYGVDICFGSSPSAGYTGIQARVIDKVTNKELESWTDFEYDYPVMDKAGTYPITITGKGDYAAYDGIITVAFKILPVKVKASDLSVPAVSVAYTGSAIKWKPGLENLKYENDSRYEYLIKDADYTITKASYKNNKSVGTASATLTMKFSGNYSGTVTKTFKYKIVPKAVKPLKYSKSRTTITAKWKKHTAQTTGFRIKVYKVIDNDYDICKKVQTVYAKSKSATSKKITGLKKNTEYKVVVQAYKTVNGKKYYSKAKTKYITTSK